VLSDFEAWLTDAFAASEPTAAEVTEALDLHTLLGQFIGLRQEVNLQTRATRAQQEQNAETLRQLTEALAALRQAPSPVDDEAKALLKTLVDLYDALAIAGREICRLETSLLPPLQEIMPTAETGEPEPATVPARSWWGRWFGGSRRDIERLQEQYRRQGQARAERDRKAREGVERIRQALASLVAGYGMSLQRLERALRTHGLEPILTVGQRFDPERMEVLEVVAESGHSSGEVVDEVRRGYVQDGHVYRYAQVRVAR
jgi:molecular chaperone GrpE